MSQLYVPDGALTTCLEGKLNSEIKVLSQSRSYINNKLKATEEDRFSDNFHCQKMVSGTSSFVAFVSTAVGCLAGPAGPFIGYLGGKFIGGFLGNKVATTLLPSLCSTLCKPSQWTVVHPKVRIQGKKALLEKANIRCLMGGTIFIILPDMNQAILHAEIAKDVYEDNDDSLLTLDQDGVQRLSEEEVKEILDKDYDILNQENNTGFYAALYKDREGNIIVAYRGTADPKDAMEDYTQAMAISSDQYDTAVDLAEKIQEAKDDGKITGDVSITGHSLGGGLATIAGATTGYPTYTYNAAAVHESTYTKEQNQVDPNNTRHVQAYVGSQDPLNGLQDNREMVLSGAVLVSPALPAVGTAVGSLGGGGGALVGQGAGTLLGGFLAYSGLRGLIVDGMPRQGGMQRIVVPQDCGWLEGHMIDPTIEALKNMQQSMGGGKPVIAREEIIPGSLSRKDILKEYAQEKLEEVKTYTQEKFDEIKTYARETTEYVEQKAQDTVDYTQQKVTEVKEYAAQKAEEIREKAGEIGEYMHKKGEQAKERVIELNEYAREKGREISEYVNSKTDNWIDYVNKNWEDLPD